MTAAISQRNSWFVANLVRAWHRIYCFGIDAAVREMRAIELESDLWEQQQDADMQRCSPARAQLDVAGRLLRGIPADISWRLRLEGPPMSISLPFERIAGALLLMLVLAIPVAISISGYDPAREGWESELRRLADIPPTHTRVTIFFQVTCGLALIGAGAGFFTALRDRARAISGIAGFGLAAAGILTLVTSALYSALSVMADDYVGGHAGTEALVTTRAIVLTLDNLTGVTGVLLAGSVMLIAYSAWRQGLVPAWMRWIPVASASLVASALFANFFDFGEATWLLLSTGFLSLIAWMILAGGAMLLRPIHTPAAAS